VADDPVLIDEVEPEREESPGSPEELSRIMRQAYENNFSVVPVGGGTKLHIGNLPRTANLVLRTGRIRGIAEYEPDNLTVSVRAGTPLQELQDTLKKHRQYLPLDPPNPERATLGGLVSCNTSGPLRFRYGTIRDFLLGVKIIHADGTATKAGGKLVKNVTGYDMCRLYTGSFGTLGILTELTFKVFPRPDKEATVVVEYPSLSAALDAAQTIIRSDLQPDAMEAWNNSALQPILNVEGSSPWKLMMRFGEVEAAVLWQLEQLRKIIPAGGGILLHVTKAEESEQFWHNAASAREEGADGESAVVKCSVSFQSTAETARKLEEIGDRLGARTLLYCHAGTHIIYGRFELSREAGSDQDLRKEFSGLRNFCSAREGHTVVERVRSSVKSGFDVWGYNEPALKVMKRLKQEFDPKGLLNPGRFVGGI